MEPFLDCYALLQVSPDASPEEIAKAFRALALQLHPDRNTSPNATARFIELRRAYDVLSNPAEREVYDRTYRLRKHKQGHWDREYPAVAPMQQKQPSSPQPASLYIIMHFEPGHSAQVVFNQATYSLTADEVTRLTRDGMLRVQSGDGGDDLLMYCVHCHAFFTRRSGNSVVTIHDMPYEHFPMCPQCQSVDWCPANDVLEQGERQKKAEQWFQEGEAFRADSDYYMALDAYEQAVLLDPSHARAWSKKADALRHRGRHGEMLPACERALHLDPKDVNSWFNKAFALDWLGRPEEALAAYEQTLRLDPNHALAWNNKGSVLKTLGRYEEALAAYEQTLRLDPNDIYAWNNKGSVLKTLGRYEEALITYEQHLRLVPKHIDIWINKGKALMKLGRFKEAVTAYKQALHLDPNNRAASAGHAEALENLHRGTRRWFKFFKH